MDYSQLLKEQINKVQKLDDDVFEALIKPWEEVSFARKQLITKAGEVEKYLYFVLDGVQRSFFQHGDKEPTLVFSFKLSFSGVIDSFFTQTPSRFHLETITHSKLVRIHYNDLSRLMKEYRQIESWVRIATMWVLSGTLERQVELMSYTAEEKFVALLRRSPHVLNMIPHKYLASYIGVDPTTFSKLLGSIKL